MEVVFLVKKYDTESINGLVDVLKFWSDGINSNIFDGGVPHDAGPFLREELDAMQVADTQILRGMVEWLGDGAPTGNRGIVDRFLSNRYFQFSYATSGSFEVTLLETSAMFVYRGRRGSLNGYACAKASAYLYKMRSFLKKEEDRGNMKVVYLESEDLDRPWWDSSGCPEKTEGEPWLGDDHLSQ